MNHRDEDMSRSLKHEKKKINSEWYNKKCNKRATIARVLQKKGTKNNISDNGEKSNVLLIMYFTREQQTKYHSWRPIFNMHTVVYCICMYIY